VWLKATDSEFLPIGTVSCYLPAAALGAWAAGKSYTMASVAAILDFAGPSRDPRGRPRDPPNITSPRRSRYRVLSRRRPKVLRIRALRVVTETCQDLWRAFRDGSRRVTRFVRHWPFCGVTSPRDWRPGYGAPVAPPHASEDETVLRSRLRGLDAVFAPRATLSMILGSSPVSA
jgi:hypothetical protein